MKREKTKIRKRGKKKMPGGRKCDGKKGEDDRGFFFFFPKKKKKIGNISG